MAEPRATAANAPERSYGPYPVILSLFRFLKSNPSRENLYSLFFQCWLQFLAVFLVFFVSLAIFPAVLVDIKPLHHFTGRMGNFFPLFSLQRPFSGEIYYGLTVFLNFNFFAAVGNLTAVFIQFVSFRPFSRGKISSRRPNSC